MSESDELDLRNAKWKMDKDIHLSIIKKAILDNYPIEENQLENEIFSMGFLIGDLEDPDKIKSIMESLADKYNVDK